jgi:RNA polymerase sigma-70 factor (ECF subfamily)
MNEEHTTAVVQPYLDNFGGDSAAEPIAQNLLDRAVPRLHLLYATLAHRRYLTRPPFNVQVHELLGPAATRLFKALREARPRTLRQLLAHANQHMRWERHDLARRLDNQPVAVELCEELVPSPASVCGLTPEGLRMLGASHVLPEDKRGVFDLMRIHGMTQAKAAELLDVSTTTAKRRLSRGLRLLTVLLADRRRVEKPTDAN